MDERGLVERVDHLTAAVADLAFKLDTLISSTTAFRESFGERMTDYADLVAHWSIETEQNLQSQRRSLDRALAAQEDSVGRLATVVEGVVEAVGKSERRVLEGIESLPRESVDLAPVLDEMQQVRAAHDRVVAAVREAEQRIADAVHDEPGQADALAAVLAEVTAVRQEVASLPREAVDISPVADELRQLRQVLSEADVDDVEDEVSFAAALGEQLAALREDVAALGKQQRPASKGEVDPAVVEAIAGLRRDVVALRERVAAVPPVPPEVTALTDALQALRSELENEHGGDATVAPVAADDRLEETLAELVYEVRALRRRFPVRPSADDGDSPAPPRRRRRDAD